MIKNYTTIITNKLKKNIAPSKVELTREAHYFTNKIWISS
jgi:hypothetical protein